MNDAEWETLKQRVNDCQAKWKEILPLGMWDISTTFWRDKWDKDTHGYDCVAVTSPHWEYLHALVEWNMSKLFDMEVDDAELDMIVVHEFTHMLIDELVDYATSKDREANFGQVERVTSTLTLGFIWSRNMVAVSSNDESKAEPITVGGSGSISAPSSDD